MALTSFCVQLRPRIPVGTIDHSVFELIQGYRVVCITGLNFV